MQKNSKTDCRKYTWTIVLSFALIAFFCVLINLSAYEGTRTLYLDDLSLYNRKTSTDTSMIEKIFSRDLNKNRYIYNAIVVPLINIVGLNFELYDYIFLIENIIIAFVFFGIAMNIIRSKDSHKNIIVACGVTLGFSISRFSYYSVTEIGGIMENLAMLQSWFIILLLLKDNQKYTKKYTLAIIMYIVAMYVHERYFVLAGVFLCYLFFGFLENRKISILIKRAVVIVMIPMLFMIHRCIIFGGNALEGTGGTEIISTFDVKQFLGFILVQVKYIFGINSIEDPWLSGIDARYVPRYIYLFNAIVLLSVALIVILYIRTIIREKLVFVEIQRIAIFMVSIACLIIASSVTIRVEMRWVYASFSIYLLFIVYMYSVISLYENKSRKCLSALLFLSLICLLCEESYYRSKWDNLYYWKERELSSAIVEKIVDYEEKFINKITILSNAKDLSEDKIKELCVPYGITIEEIEYVDNTALLDLESDIILLKNPEENEYSVITEMCKDITEISYAGRYQDGWTTKECVISLYSMESNRISFNCLALKEQYLTVYVNGEEIKEKIHLSVGGNKFYIECEPKETLKIKLVSDVEYQLSEEDKRVCSYVMYTVVREIKTEQVEEKESTGLEQSAVEENSKEVEPIGDEIVYLEGRYDDCWMQKVCRLKLRTKEADLISFTCMALEEQTLTVYVNGEEQEERIHLLEGGNKFYVSCEPEEVVEIKLVSDKEYQLEAPDTRVCSYVMYTVERETEAEQIVEENPEEAEPIGDEIVYLEGRYDDCWIQKVCRLKLRTKEADLISFTCMALEEQTLTVYVNGEEQEEKIYLLEGGNKFYVSCEPGGVVEIKLVSDKEYQLEVPDTRVCSYVMYMVEREIEQTTEENPKGISEEN